MAKLTVEYAENGRELIIRKARGKLTFDEVVKLLNSNQYYNSFAGMLGVFQFRIKGNEYLYDGYSDDDDEGDVVILDMVGDDSVCPVCGKHKLYPQYCPECGRELTEPGR